MSKIKIALFYPSWSVFVQTDYAILSAAATVQAWHFRPAKGAIRVALELLKQLLFLVTKGHRYNIFYCWFADQHSLLPVLYAKLFRKPCYLVIGGYDVARMPELNYGVFVSRLRGFAAAYSMRNSTANFAVSDHVRRKVQAIAPGSAVSLVYNCIASPPEKSTGPPRNKVLTIALIDSERTFLLKGIDRYVEVARLIPELSFVIVGMTNSYYTKIRTKLPENIKIVPPTPHQLLGEFYHDARICCQLSRSESFGIALAESIGYGCIPLVTKVGGLPEIVQEPEFMVSDDPLLIAKTLRKLWLSAPPPKTPSMNILGKFSKDNRARLLYDLMDIRPSELDK